MGFTETSCVSRGSPIFDVIRVGGDNNSSWRNQRPFGFNHRVQCFQYKVSIWKGVCIFSEGFVTIWAWKRIDYWSQRASSFGYRMLANIVMWEFVWAEQLDFFSIFFCLLPFLNIYLFLYPSKSTLHSCYSNLSPAINATVFCTFPMLHSGYLELLRETSTLSSTLFLAAA